MEISAKQIEVLKQSTLSLTKYLDNISIAIIGTDKNQQPAEIGSGTCIKIGDTYLIATAAHCIRGYKMDDLFLIHSKSPKPKDISINKIGFRGGGDCDLLDIAWLELTEETARTIEKEFIDLKDIVIDIYHIHDDLTFVSGFPGALIDHVKENKLLSVTPIGYLTITIDPPSIGQTINKYDIFFDYPKDGNLVFDNRAKELPDPKGISGGGFWSLNINTEGIWSNQKIKLFGIDRSWSPTKRWIKGIQIQHWLKMIIEDFPALEKEIINYFPKLNT
ncbi:MAG: hypothetical protein WBH40_10805 [Ignavibacteriaceae bacterium]